MPQAIKTALYTKLVADQTAGTLYAAVGGRIYEAEGPDDAALPLLTYDVTSSPVAGLFDDEIIVVSTVNFTIFGHRRLGAAAIGDIEDKLFSLIESVALAPTGYDRGVVVCQDRDRRTVLDEIIASESTYTIEATST